LTCAENANHSLHNIQTLRGARTRDAANFARYLDEAIDLWGQQSQLHYGPHTWPVWGNENVVEFLSSQRDTYKYLHDQSLRLANHGLTPVEISETLHLPATLGHAWWNRGYHGTVNHNTKAVFAKELGWYNGNPMTLHPLPDGELGRRYVAAMGGTDRVVELAREAFAAGDYRWVVELAGRAVFADPSSLAAREIQADAYEQLGYQAEGPQWRNIYLTAAQDLRQEESAGARLASDSPGTIAAMPVDALLDYAGVRLNGPHAEDVEVTINLNIESVGPYALKLRNCVLNYWPRTTADPYLTLTLDRLTLAAILFQPEAFDNAVTTGKITASGDPKAFHTLAGLLDTFDPNFDLLTPHI
jgi:alkyl sulfatase BDS1-like metallo-beta-lactamase superfamily hydrolase